MTVSDGRLTALMAFDKSLPDKEDDNQSETEE
jgi:hypothetical protein